MANKVAEPNKIQVKTEKISMTSAGVTEKHSEVTENHDDRLKYSVGDHILAQDDRYQDKKWYHGVVVEMDAKTKRVKVHFKNFHKKWDQWKLVNSDTIKKGEKTPSKRSSRLSSQSQQTPKQQKVTNTTASPKPINATPVKVNVSAPTSTRRLNSIQLPLMNPAEASPPPQTRADAANLDENNATTLATRYFKTRKVLANSLGSEEISQNSPVKKPKMSPNSAKDTLNTITANSIPKSPRSSSLRNNTQNDVASKSTPMQNTNSNSIDTIKTFAKPVRKTTENDKKLVENMFGGLVSISNDGTLSCKVANCPIVANNPHLIMFHLQLEHPSEFHKATVSVVVPSKTEKNQTRSIHKGSMDLSDIRVNCVCKSTASIGFLIRCSLCKQWQHGNCISLTDSNPPSTYLCFECIIKPNSASMTYNPVFVATIDNKLPFGSANANSIKEVPNYINAFTIGHTFDTYRSILSKLSKQLESPSMNIDTVMSSLKDLQNQLSENRNSKIKLEEMRENIDNLILKI